MRASSARSSSCRFSSRDSGWETTAFTCSPASVGAYASLLDLGVGYLTSQDGRRKHRHGRQGPRAESGVHSTRLLFRGWPVRRRCDRNRGTQRWQHLQSRRGRRAPLRNLLLVSAVASLWTWPANTAGAVLAGLQRYVVTARTATFAIIANIAITIVVLLTRSGPFAMMVGSALVGLVASSVNAYLAWTNSVAGRISPLIPTAA